MNIVDSDRLVSELNTYLKEQTGHPASYSPEVFSDLYLNYQDGTLLKQLMLERKVVQLQHRQAIQTYFTEKFPID